MTDETGAAGPQSSTEDELTAMGNVASAVETLDDRTRRRVIGWAAEKYGVATPGPARGRVERVGTSPKPGGEDEPAEYGDFADLYDAVDPQSDRHRLLVAGYWLQVRQKEANLHADNVNEILTPLGHRIERVRDVLPSLLTGSPRLMIRSGKNKGSRGRVLFRLSAAGIKAVDDALAAGGFAGAE